MHFIYLLEVHALQIRWNNAYIEPQRQSVNGSKPPHPGECNKCGSASSGVLILIRSLHETMHLPY